MIKANGFDHPKTKEAILAWLDQREQEVMQAEDTDYAGFVLNVERAELYAAANLIDDAFNALEDALLQVDNRIDDKKEEMKKRVNQQWALLVDQNKK